MRKLVIVASSVLMPLAALCGGTGQPAQAADLDWRSDRSLKDDGPIIVPRAAFSWTGFYIGGHVGYAWGHSSTFSDDDGFDGESGFSIHPSGWLGGVHAGYNWQADTFLVGIEAELGMIGASDDQSSALAFVDAEYGGYGTVAARLGFAADRWLFYIKGGLALANIENRGGAIVGGVIDPTDFTSVEEIRAGWTLGGGAEYAFQRDWSLKVEYLYMDFGEDSSGNLDGDSFRHDNDLHTIKVGVSYRLQSYQEPLR